MKIPDKIKIGIYWYKVIQGHRFESPDKWGSTDFKTSTIYLSDLIDGQNLEQTFFHEMLHAIDKVYNADKLTEEDATPADTLIEQTKATSIYDY